MNQKSGMSSAGFTLLELIVILIIIGILAVAVAPRFFFLHTFAARSFYDQSLAMVRYAQKVAVAQRTHVQVRLDSANGPICLQYGESAATVPCASKQHNVLNPADSKPFLLAVPPEVTVQLNGASDVMFSFNALGRPSAPASLRVIGDGTTRTITIEQETGYVH